MDNHSFEYTYNAQHQKEVEEIRRKYLPKEENKIEQLRKLHHSTNHKAQSVSIALGIIGTLIMGTGMSLILTDLGNALGNLALVIGIAVGLAGIILVALAYPIYNCVLEKERARIAPEILRLTEELMR